MKIIRYGFSYIKVKATDEEIEKLIYSNADFNKEELLSMYDGSKALYRGDNIWYLICHNRNNLRNLLERIISEYGTGFDFSECNGS